MADETLTNENTEENDIQKYLDTINELKQNTISREEYDKIRNENKTLLEAIVNGKTEDAAASGSSPTPTTDELRNKIFGKNCEDLSDLEFVKGLCDLRDSLLEETGVDYFAPTGSQYSADFNDAQTAQKVYDGFRHCIEVADGDNEIFIQEMTRITNDIGIRKPKRR
jgi:hypothetical protein